MTLRYIIILTSCYFFAAHPVFGASACKSQKTKAAPVKANINISGKDIDNNEVLNALRAELRAMKEQLNQFQDDKYQTDLTYYKKYHEYLAKKADINLEQFLWQRRASEFILGLVVAVVISGISFSGLQLWRASNLSSISTDSTIEIAAQKIKVTSSVVGVIVLTISIVFLYFFLVEVYRVKVVDLAPAEVKPIIGSN
jgi:hypothetical protein